MHCRVVAELYIAAGRAARYHRTAARKQPWLHTAASTVLTSPLGQKSVTTCWHACQHDDLGSRSRRAWLRRLDGQSPGITTTDRCPRRYPFPSSRPAEADPPDSEHPAVHDSAHACTPSSCGRPCGQAVPAPFGCPIRLRENASQTSGGTNGRSHAWSVLPGAPPPTRPAARPTRAGGSATARPIAGRDKSDQPLGWLKRCLHP
jgi:hypothetical protein